MGAEVGPLFLREMRVAETQRQAARRHICGRFAIFCLTHVCARDGATWRERCSWRWASLSPSTRGARE